MSLQITIASPPGEGKTILAFLIKKALTDEGFPVRIEDGCEEDMETVEIDWEKKIPLLLRHFEYRKSPPVVIKTVQTKCRA